ncbi:MAG: pyrroline-5-carboxylate reductase [Propionibacteriaceae bacterium]|jgi:pyrroline-5-carboxylate reductase|nr:pyrroline-5-carboxylate reductase [Propionibacteriaceae bacterium]
MITAILGVGMMGEALLVGLIWAGIDPARLRAADARPERCDQVRDTHGVWVGTVKEASQGADTVIIAVKPQDVVPLLTTIAPELGQETLVISLAAGVTLATLEANLNPGQAVIRVMPNTPTLIGEGMAVLSPGQAVADEQMERAVGMLSAVGKAQVLPETFMDAVTALSGSGPAYLMYLAEAMIEAGVSLGLDNDTATALVKQTLSGSSRLLAESSVTPTILRERVTSPGGTTAAAIQALENRAVKPAFIAAIDAAARRSQELGKT